MQAEGIHSDLSSSFPFPADQRTGREMAGRARERDCQVEASLHISGVCNGSPTLPVWLQATQYWTRSEELHEPEPYFSTWGFANSTEDFGTKIQMFVFPIINDLQTLKSWIFAFVQ